MPRPKGTRKSPNAVKRTGSGRSFTESSVTLISTDPSPKKSSKRSGTVPKAKPQRASLELIEKTRQLMERTIDYVPHPFFDREDAFKAILQLRPASLDVPAEIVPSDPGVVFVTGLAQAPLLTKDEEVYWFTWMNFLKFRAEQNRRLLDLGQPQASLIQQIEDDLRQANAARNHIVQGNLRLVVSLAKKLSVSMEQMSEMISEGMMPLIRAVELFNIALGNRFSTYATWAVRNQMIRWLKKSRSGLEASRVEESPSLENFPDPHAELDETENPLQVKADAVLRLLNLLTERERQIVAARFALEGEPTGQSLADISKRLGLCKERVRQIACHSLAKLREAIAEEELELNN